MQTRSARDPQWGLGIEERGAAGTIVTTGCVAFIRQHTRLQRPPFTPELQLYLADTLLPLWTQIEDERGERWWAAAVLGVRLGRRPGAGALPAGPSGRGRRQAGAGFRHRLRPGGHRGAAGRARPPRWPPTSTRLRGGGGAERRRPTGCVCAFTGGDLLAADPAGADVILAGDICLRAADGRACAGLAGRGPGAWHDPC